LKQSKRLVIVLGSLFLASPAMGENFSDCLSEIQRAASAEGISTSTLRKVFNGLRPDARVIKLDRHQPERILTLDEYLQRVVPETRIHQGGSLLMRHAEMLQKISERFGVEAELLVALWGIETDFGRVLGRFDVTRSLATLACDARRPAFFKNELLHHLHLLDQDPHQRFPLQGSWAGAFGYLQFLPSVLRCYGVDQNKDGRIDIFSPSEDLFATAASYLHASGWRAGRPWGAELRPPYPLCVTERQCPESPQAFLAQADLSLDLKKHLLSAVGPVRVIYGSGAPTRYFLAMPNFEALLKWNRSDKYAIAVGLLMDGLKTASH